VRLLLEDAEKTARKQAEQSKALAQEQCAQLEKASGERLDLAARRIVERIVNS
jgi:hypothetical protein